MHQVPNALKRWFVVHFVVDVVFAVPLLVAPRLFLGALGWSVVDPFSARLVAAALFAIGIESFLARHASVASYCSMITLKIIWSTAAILGMGLTVVESPAFRTPASYLLIGVFVGFNVVWVYWKKRLGDARLTY